MAEQYNGERVTVTRFCGRESLGQTEPTRTMFTIIATTGIEGRYDNDLDLTRREAEELIIVLQAALLQWRGEL